MRIESFARFGVFGGGLFFAINGLAAPFFTLYASELGAPTFAIGLMVTLKAVLPIFIAMPAGQLIDTVGPMKMLQVGSVFLLASLLATLFATELLMLSLSQILMGAAIVIMASSFQVLVAQGERETRNEAIKTYAMWMSGGGMLGPIVGGAIASQFAVPVDGYRAAFLASTGAAIVFMLVLTVLSRRYRHPVAEQGVQLRDVLSPKGILESYRRGGDLTVHRPVQFGLIATFLIMYIQALYMSFLPLYLAQNGFATMLIAVVVSLKGLAGMLSRYLLTWLTRKYSLETILLRAGTLAAICVVLTPLAVVSPASMLALAAVLGAAVGVNLPVSIMIMVDAVGESERGKLMGLRLLSNRFSQIISPVMFGGLGQLLGLTVAFYSGGALLVATLIGFAAFSRSRMGMQDWQHDNKPAE